MDLEYLLGDGMRPLMLPDYADTHLFAYEHAWGMGSDLNGRLIRSHIAGDWWIHFGDRLAEPARRRGWAYYRMGTIARMYEQFYRDACEKNLCAAPDPNDSRRGWAHTMVEYSVDTFLARTGWFDGAFNGIQERLADLLSNQEAWCRLLSTQRVNPSDARVWERTRQYSAQVARSESPEDLAVMGAIGKFGLEFTREAREHVVRYQDKILAEVPEEEYWEILGSMTKFASEIDLGMVAPLFPGAPVR
ncbi:hypothetical protein Acsp06_62580 [Actinomycetospora sp. NBRC 106375]|uniref:hypothetical protein n=1 Tax=Actinomycetospora sp. NBRC 106375 TaxID=3032207 RepID=UPI0024A4B2D7|nr:hypothetical protein [Actinomycetospora sp. NBRC 106375]GLZ50073.1 hypothetical protein Acsp06_62580 [Actinomycetospora sp. NBRC 106375]